MRLKVFFCCKLVYKDLGTLLLFNFENNCASFTFSLSKRMSDKPMETFDTVVRLNWKGEHCSAMNKFFHEISKQERHAVSQLEISDLWHERTRRMNFEAYLSVDAGHFKRANASAAWSPVLELNFGWMTVHGLFEWMNKHSADSATDETKCFSFSELLSIHRALWIQIFPKKEKKLIKIQFCI